MESKEINGVVVIDKPEGMSSFSAVKLVKKLLGVKKAGHMGTLDPLASGVLVIGLGKATKLFDEFLKQEKEYYAEFKFGVETDTLDREGKVIARDKNLNISHLDVKAVLPEFVGKQSQMPPVYSAKKIDGKKACDLARQGEEVNLTPKEVEVTELTYRGWQGKNTYAVKIKCKSGFYVRALGRDIAKRLNTYATTVCIRRLRCSGFNILHAQPLEELRQGKAIIYKLAEEQ